MRQNFCSGDYLSAMQSLSFCPSRTHLPVKERIKLPARVAVRPWCLQPEPLPRAAYYELQLPIAAHSYGQNEHAA